MSKTCNPKNKKSKDNKYICNSYTGRWIMKNGRVAQIILLSKNNPNKECKSQKDNYVCNPLTGRLVKVGSRTHKSLLSMNVFENEDNSVNQFTVGEKVLFYFDGEYIDAVYVGKQYAYVVYDLGKQKSMSVSEAIQLYNEDPEKASKNWDFRFNMNIIDVLFQTCDQHNENPQNCKYPCKWTTYEPDSSDSPYSDTSDEFDGWCEGDPKASVNIGDIITSEDGEDKIVVIDRYKVDAVEMDGTIQLAPYDDQIIKVIDIDSLLCNEIVALIHGTSDKGLRGILKTNRIQDKISPMGAGYSAVSTYPLLNCDLGHNLPFNQMWGENKIFIDKQALNDFIGWKLSIPTDISADPNKMPYTKGKINTYFEKISDKRYNIWTDTDPETKEIQDEDYYHLNFDDYSGELAFFKSIAPLKPYIKFIAILRDKKDLIDEVQAMGIKVVQLDHQFEEFYLDPKLFS